MKKMLYIFIIIVLILIAYIFITWGIGDLINEEKSRSYFEKNGTIYFSANGHWGMGGSSEKVIADLESFEILSEYIARDKNSIFAKHMPQDHVDYATFSIDDNFIIRDKEYVYEFGDDFRLEPIAIKGLDVETFEYLNSTHSMYGWSKDKNHYYFKQKIMNIDYENIVFMEGFFYDKDTLYTDLYNTKIQTIKKIDEAPIQITSQYVSSSNTLCYLHIDSNGITSLKTIEFDEVGINFRVINDYVLATKNEVIYYGEIYNEVDVSTFEMVYNSQMGRYKKYYKDKNNVYFDKEIISNADPKSIKLLDRKYAIDDNYVFYDTKIINGADPKSFKILKQGYSLDDKHVFHEDKLLDDAGPKTFRRKENRPYWLDDKGNKYNHFGERL